MMTAFLVLNIGEPVKLFVFYDATYVRIEKVEQLCKVRDNGHDYADNWYPANDCTVEPTYYFDQPVAPTPRPDKKTFITFRYNSPADDSTHIGLIPRKFDEKGRPFVVGDTIKVYVSRSNPWAVVVPKPDQD